MRIALVYDRTWEPILPTAIVLHGIAPFFVSGGSTAFETSVTPLDLTIDHTTTTRETRSRRGLQMMRMSFI
jgi:hypothetical protein